jgi:hypothetical protein
MSTDGDMEGLVKEVWILNKFYNDSKCGLNEGGQIGMKGAKIGMKGTKIGMKGAKLK